MLGAKIVTKLPYLQALQAGCLQEPCCHLLFTVSTHVGDHTVELLRLEVGVKTLNELVNNLQHPTKGAQYTHVLKALEVRVQTTPTGLPPTHARQFLRSGANTSKETPHMRGAYPEQPRSLQQGLLVCDQDALALHDGATLNLLEIVLTEGHTC